LEGKARQGVIMIVIFNQGNDISQPLPNNNLELTVTSTGIGSHTNTNQAAGARDII